MSDVDCEGSLSSITLLGLEKDELFSPSAVSDVSLGKSIHHCDSLLPLRMINLDDSS